MNDDQSLLDQFLIITETKLMGFGESDSSGCWIKLEIQPEDLPKFRGRKGNSFELALKFTDEDSTKEKALAKQSPPKGPYSEFATKLHKNGFFRSPDVWSAVGDDADYLDWLRDQPSAKSGKFCDYVNGIGRSVAAHVRHAGRGGTGYKPPYSAIPLSDAEHKESHQHGDSIIGDREWWEQQRIKHLARWAEIRFKSILGIDSLSELSPRMLEEWAEQTPELVSLVKPLLRDYHA